MRDVLPRRISDATGCNLERATRANLTTERQLRRHGHFRKLALSTDKFILNVIPRR